MHHKGSLFIISAPSGAGKTSLVKALIKEMSNIVVSVSYTTRPKREDEKEGIDYHFVTSDEVSRMLKQNIFLEHAEVFGNFYGTSQIWVEEARIKGQDVVLEIDWQGARQVRMQLPEAYSIFILPPSREILEERLAKRHPDNSKLVMERMQEARAELSRYNEYDYIVCNDQFDEALADLKSLVRAHRLKAAKQIQQNASLLEKLMS